MIPFDLRTIIREGEQERIEIVRLRTSYWKDRKGIHFRKSLLSLRRKSKGCTVLDNDSDMIGADEVWPSILNINQCKDGVYKVVICNEKMDWESGMVEEYDYKLIPYSDDKAN